MQFMNQIGGINLVVYAPVNQHSENTTNGYMSLVTTSQPSSTPMSVSTRTSHKSLADAFKLCLSSAVHFPPFSQTDSDAAGPWYGESLGWVSVWCWWQSYSASRASPMSTPQRQLQLPSSFCTCWLMGHLSTVFRGAMCQRSCRCMHDLRGRQSECRLIGSGYVLRFTCLSSL